MGDQDVRFRRAKIDDAPALAELIYLAAQSNYANSGYDLQCFPSQPPDFWSVDHVAALPDFRGRGLTRGCLRAMLKRGRQEDFRKAKRDVFRRNYAARSLYDSFGFKPTETFDNVLLYTLLKRDALERMVLTL